VLADQIIYSVGFFAIVYSAYIMVLDRYGHLVESGGLSDAADRFAGKSSRGPWAVRLSRGSPRTDTLSDSH
jgi:hypothetical protein